MFTTQISSSNIIALHMRQLAFDGIGMPLAALVEKAAGHHQEPVPRHLCLVRAEPAMGGADGLLRDGPIVTQHAREPPLYVPTALPQLIHDRATRARERNFVCSTHIQLHTDNG